MSLVDQPLQLDSARRQRLALRIELLAVVEIVRGGIDERARDGTVTEVGATTKATTCDQQRNRGG